MSDYYLLITDAGAALEASAHAAGTTVNLSEFGVCDGGAEFIPDPTKITFDNEVYHGEISSLSVSADDASVLVAQCIIPADSGGYTIRGIAIYTDDGTLYATGNYPDQPKPAPDSGFAASLEILAELAVSDTADVTLVVTEDAYLTEPQADTLYLRQDKNLSEIATAGADAQSAARQNLGLGDAATHAAGDFLSVTGGEITGPMQFDDSIYFSGTSAVQRYSGNVFIPDTGTGGWYKLATISLGQKGKSCIFKVITGSGYNGKIYQNSYLDIVIRTGNSQITTVNADGRAAVVVHCFGDALNCAITDARIIETSEDIYDLYCNVINYAGESLSIIECDPDASVTLGATIYGDGSTPPDSNLEHDVYSYLYSSDINRVVSTTYPVEASAFESTDAVGATGFVDQYDTMAPYYHTFSDTTDSTYHPLWKIRDETQQVTWSGGILVNTGYFVISSCDEVGNYSDTTFRPNGEIDTHGAIYENGQRVYSPNNPPPQSWAVTNIQLGAQYTKGYGGGSSVIANAGGVLVGLQEDQGDNEIHTYYYKPIQKYINGAWATISG